MEKIVGRTQYNTNRDIKTVGNGLSVLFINSSSEYYLCFSEGRLVPMKFYEVEEWIKLNLQKFAAMELERVKKFIHITH